MSRTLSASAYTKLLLSLLTSFLLVACGGDKAPEAFSFIPQTDLAPDTQAVSNTVTISGIDSDVTLSISGGEYSVDGADFTSAAGIILNDQTLQLRAQTPLGFSESKTVVITLNEAIEEFKVAEEFKLATFAQDITPEEFVFGSVENSALNTWITSDLVTITDINDALDITADNLEYSIEGGDYTSSNGVITNGQNLRVRILSASSFNTSSVGSITVGNLSVPFSIVTSEVPQVVSLDLVAGSEIEVGEDLVANAVCIECDESNTLYSWNVEGIDQVVSTEKHYRVTAETVLKEISVSATAVSLAGDEGDAITRTYTKNRVKEIVGNNSAFAAIKLDGAVVTWGKSEFGGESSLVEDQLINVQSIASTYKAMAAIKTDGTVVTWGDVNSGGDSRSVSEQLINVKSIAATDAAFGAIKSDGSVVTWGNDSWGGNSTSVTNQLTQVKSISATAGAFAAIKSDGSVVTWGSTSYGGDSSLVANQLVGVRSIFANTYAFAALRTDGSVVTWGFAGYGGSSTSVADQLVDVQSISATNGAFAAIRADGTVVTWGRSGWGSNSGWIADKLITVEFISATAGAFAAIKSDGSVVTWGNDGGGGDSRSVLDQLTQIKTVSATAGAFAAIKSDGSVVTWGDTDFGSDPRWAADSLINVLSISSTDRAFAAIKRDGSVVTWGDGEKGGFVQDRSKLEPGGIMILK